MAAPELMTIDVDETEQSTDEGLSTSLIYSREQVDIIKARFRGMVGQLTLEMILVPEAALEALDI